MVARTFPRSGPSPTMIMRAGIFRRSSANASTARVGALRAMSRPIKSTTGVPVGCVWAAPTQEGTKPSASMNRMSLPPRRTAAAAVSELHTRVTAEFRIVSRLRLFSFSIRPVDIVLAISTGHSRPK